VAFSFRLAMFKSGLTGSRFGLDESSFRREASSFGLEGSRFNLEASNLNLEAARTERFQWFLAKNPCKKWVFAFLLWHGSITDRRMGAGPGVCSLSLYLAYADSFTSLLVK
jgi:hypothetical protein